MIFNKMLFRCFVAAVLTSFSIKSSEAVQLHHSQTRDNQRELIGKRAPSFSLLNMKGETVSLEDYRGKVLVINFWASWSRSCVDWLPAMQLPVNKYGTDSDVKFLFINTFERDENYQTVVGEFMESNGYTFNVVFDEMRHPSKAAVMAYGVTSIPASIFVDRKGVIRFYSIWKSGNAEQIVKEIDEKIALTRRSGGVQLKIN